MTRIAMNDFRADAESLVQAELKACERVLRSGWWILGEEVKAFEQEWANWVDTPHAVGCGNGLDAIEIGLRALKIGAGDEVITTPMTAFATVLAIIRAGATPVFADIDSDTGMLSPESVRRCVSPRTKAVLLVHLYGRIGPIDELLAIAKEANIQLIEDCAQAHGASLRGKSAGRFGVFAAWSFYPTKNLGAIGDAGAITTESKIISEQARAIRNYGQSVRYHHPIQGMNSRLDELQAAILRERLGQLHHWIERRRQIAQQYVLGLHCPLVQTMTPPSDRRSHSYHLFVVITEHRSELQQHLDRHGIDSLIHYPVPMHLQEPCRDFRRDAAGLSATEAHANTCLSLPCHPALSDEQIATVISAVNEFRA